MKRHEILQPFSRDHNVGLVVARHLADVHDQNSVQELLAVWDDEMKDHFEEEERLLIPLATSELASRLVAEHRQIGGEVERARRGELSEPEIAALGVLLGNHIRWEERVLFSSLEESENIESIREGTDALEKRRWNSKHSPRRQELMSRKKTDA